MYKLHRHGALMLQKISICNYHLYYMNSDNKVASLTPLQETRTKQKIFSESTYLLACNHCLDNGR